MSTMTKFLAGAALAAVLGFGSNASAADKKIERTWGAKCASCHGKDGKGATEQGGKMKVGDYTKPEWQKGITDEKIKKAIMEGIKTEKDGVKKEMDPFKDELKPEQVDGLVAFIRELK